MQSMSHARPRLAELQSDGLTWIHLEAPTHDEAQLLAARFGWHPLDVEDVLSRRERPKVDVYSEEESAGYLFAVLHFPVYNANVGRLDAGELDVFVGPDYLVTLPTVELRPVTRLFERCYTNEELRQQPLLARLGPAALRAARRPLRLLLPDPRQDRAEAAADRRGDRRDHAAREGARARHPQGEAGDHLVPQDRAPAASDAAAARARRRALPAAGPRALLRRHRRRERAHLGQRSTTTRKSSRRSRTRTSRSISHQQNDILLRAHDLQRRDAAADVHHRLLRDERPLPGLRQPERLLRDDRADGRGRSSACSASSAGSAGSRAWSACGRRGGSSTCRARTSRTAASSAARPRATTRSSSSCTAASARSCC